jgi:hypothetical protein
MTSGFTKF